MKKFHLEKGQIIEFLMMTVGTILTGAGVYFFKIPNGFSTGGFSGVAILLGKLVESVNTETFVTVLNIVSLLVGFIFLGGGVGWKTTYCTLLFVGSVNLFGWIYPMNGVPLTDDLFLELIFASLLGAIGTGMVFRSGGSTGGTDIVALIVRKYTSADFSACMLAADGVIVAATFLVFDIKIGLCSVIGLLTKTYLVQAVVDSLNRRKSLIIITSKPHEVSHYITEELHRSATVWKAQGAFTDAEKTVIFTGLTPYQASKLRLYAKSVDEHAFVTVNKTSEIYGKGFLPFE